MLEIVRFDPTPCGYPKPRVLVLPKRLPLELSSPRRRPGPSSLNSIDPGLRRDDDYRTTNFRSFARGRYALGAAYQLAGLTSGTTLLAPAYHCLTMLDPAIDLGADIRLYPLNPDLSPDLDRLDGVIDHSTSPVKALVATHFFGFRQDFKSLKNWCEQHGITLIEDGCHALFTDDYHAPGIGTVGDFVVSSPYKFFPCEDGGLLHAHDATKLKDVHTSAPSFSEELRALKRVFDHHTAARDNKCGTAQPDNFDHQLSELLHAPVRQATTEHYDYTKPSVSFSAELKQRSATRLSRWLVRRSSPIEIVKARRTNYARWLNAACGLPNCRPLYDQLPDEGVPYMFPLYIDHPKLHFDLLKRLGFPVWRWDEMAASACSTATDYRLHLLHLPCHQSLGEAQMDWLVAAMQKVMQTPAAGAC